MLPTLSPGDRLLAMRAGRIRRGEVWVLRHREELLVKRIVGLPGDKVRLTDKRAEIAQSTPAGAGSGPQPDGSWVLGPDEFLMQGDNLEESTDLRAFGPVGPEKLVARVVFRYWPRPGPVR
jgi:signal peptidase I